MVDFADFTGGEADLVSVGRIAVSRFLANFALGKFAGNGFVVRCARVSGTGDAHGLVDVGTAGKRVADTTAEASSRAAEGFNFGGVVVRFVLKLHEPFFVFRLNDDRGRIDLIGDFDIVEFTGFTQLFHAHEGDVHEGDGALGIGTVNFVADAEVGLVSVFDDLGPFVEGNLRNLRHESGMTTVIGPIGVEHAELGDGGLAVFFVAEIFLRVEEVGSRHGEAKFTAVGVKVRLGF